MKQKLIEDGAQRGHIYILHQVQKSSLPSKSALSEVTEELHIII